MSSAAVPATATPEVDKSGWLNKRGEHGLKSFRKRYFVLAGHEMRYMTAPDHKPKGAINLEGATVEICPETKYDRKFTFEVTAPVHNRVYVLEAENATQVQEWTTAIRRAMLRIRRQRAKDAQAERMRADSTDEGEGRGASARSTSQPTAADIAAQYRRKDDEEGDTDKYDVYKRWLEESKQGKSRTDGRLLIEGQRSDGTGSTGAGGANCCPCLSSCVIS